MPAVSLENVSGSVAHQAGNEACKLVTGDIRDAELLDSLMPGQQIVFHLASAHLEVNKPPEYFEEVNVTAVGRLVELCERHQVQRLVHCSSVGVFGSLQSLPADESSPCRPTIAYEKTKLAGEEALHQAVKDLDFVILRPAWVYGPRCLRTLKLLHPVYITDMLDGFEKAATVPEAKGETIIIGADEALPLDSLIEEVARAVNTDLRPITVPLTVMWPTCFLVERVWGVMGKEPPFSTRSLKFFTESSAFDISKAKNILGFQPEVDIRTGMDLTAKQFTTEGLL